MNEQSWPKIKGFIEQHLDDLAMGVNDSNSSNGLGVLSTVLKKAKKKIFPQILIPEDCIFFHSQFQV